MKFEYLGDTPIHGKNYWGVTEEAPSDEERVQMFLALSKGTLEVCSPVYPPTVAEFRKGVETRDFSAFADHEDDYCYLGQPEHFLALLFFAFPELDKSSRLAEIEDTNRVLRIADEHHAEWGEGLMLENERLEKENAELKARLASLTARSLTQTFRGQEDE